MKIQLSKETIKTIHKLFHSEIMCMEKQISTLGALQQYQRNLCIEWTGELKRAGLEFTEKTTSMEAEQHGEKK